MAARDRTARVGRIGSRRSGMFRMVTMPRRKSRRLGDWTSHINLDRLHSNTSRGRRGIIPSAVGFQPQTNGEEKKGREEEKTKSWRANVMLLGSSMAPETKIACTQGHDSTKPRLRPSSTKFTTLYERSFSLLVIYISFGLGGASSSFRYGCYDSTLGPCHDRNLLLGFTGPTGADFMTGPPGRELCLATNLAGTR